MLLNLRRQNDRWQSYCRVVCADAVTSGHYLGGSELRSFRARGLPARTAKELSQCDLEHFSGTRNHTLTRIRDMERGGVAGNRGALTDRGPRRRGAGSRAETEVVDDGSHSGGTPLPPLTERSVRTFADFA